MQRRSRNWLYVAGGIALLWFFEPFWKKNLEYYMEQRGWDRILDAAVTAMPDWISGAATWLRLQGFWGGAFSVLAVWGCLEVVYAVQRRRRAALENATENASRVKLQIVNTVFDPNLGTEMYVDFTVMNLGEPTTIQNWRLVIHPPSAASATLFPRFVMTEKLTRGALGGVENDDMGKTPLQTGETRQGRLGFAVQGPPPKERFGLKGTALEVSAEDVWGRRISARRVLPDDRLAASPNPA